MNITLKTKIRYNGQEYSSVDDLPPEVRSLYQRATAAGGKLFKKSVTGRLVVNGKEISLTDMSPVEKKLYDDAMQLIGDGATAAATTSPAPALVNAAPATNGNRSSTDTGWLTKGELRLIAFVAAVLLAVALVIALRH